MYFHFFHQGYVDDFVAVTPSAKLTSPSPASNDYVPPSLQFVATPIMAGTASNIGPRQYNATPIKSNQAYRSNGPWIHEVLVPFISNLSQPVIEQMMNYQYPISSADSETAFKAFIHCKNNTF